jgi:deoxyribonuclease II
MRQIFKEYVTRALLISSIGIGLSHAGEATPPTQEHKTIDNQSHACMNSQNQEVDWWIILKLPHNYKLNNKDHHSEGFDYLYLDNNSSDFTIHTNPNLNDKKNSPLMNTVKQLNSTVYTRLIYNDAYMENGKKKTPEYVAHAKGIMQFDEKQGYWIRHSTPRYLKIPKDSTQLKHEKYLQLKQNEVKFGQHFLCVTYNKDQENKILDVINTMRPYLLDYANSTFTGNYPWPHLERKNYTKQKRHNNKKGKGKKLTTELHSKDGLKHSVFAKDKHWAIRGQTDIYKDLIAKYYLKYYEQSVPLVRHRNEPEEFVTETWQRSSGGISPDICEPKKEIVNLHEIEIEIDKENIQWKETVDHSKWAVSLNKEQPISCFADINRMDSQALRGGSATCFTQKIIHNNMLKLIPKHFTQCKKQDESKLSDKTCRQAR